MADVVMYSKGYCPYCKRAKALFNAKGISFTNYDIQQRPALTQQMIRKSNGRRTVPQIFINGQHVGGSDDLMRLEAKGTLDTLLGLHAVA